MCWSICIKRTKKQLFVGNAGSHHKTKPFQGEIVTCTCRQWGLEFVKCKGYTHTIQRLPSLITTIENEPTVHVYTVAILWSDFNTGYCIVTMGSSITLTWLYTAISLAVQLGYTCIYLPLISSSNSQTLIPATRSPSYSLPLFALRTIQQSQPYK